MTERTESPIPREARVKFLFFVLICQKRKPLDQVAATSRFHAGFARLRDAKKSAVNSEEFHEKALNCVAKRYSLDCDLHR